MQKDTRRMTVARDHLEVARKELANAGLQTDVHVQRGALHRALNHLELARSRLLEQREFVRGATDSALHEAFDAVAAASACVAGLLDRWPAHPTAAIVEARDRTAAAIDAIDRACAIGAHEQRLHP